MNAYKAKIREEVYAGLFGLSLLVFMIGSAGLAALSTGPFVLGTEMNANGMVEYLCLGRGCESFQAMDW